MSYSYYVFIIYYTLYTYYIHIIIALLLHIISIYIYDIYILCMSYTNVKSNLIILSLVSALTHISEILSSYTDLIFTTHPNMVVESGVHHLSATPTKELFFTTPKQMLAIFKRQLILLFERMHYFILMLMSKISFIPILFRAF